MSISILKPIEGSRESVLNSLDQLLSTIRLWEQTPLVEIFKERIRGSFDYPQCVIVHIKAEYWMLQVSDFCTPGVDLYFGLGYKPGVLTGENPLSEWDSDYTLKGVTNDVLMKYYDDEFHKDSIYNLSTLIDMMYHFNNGEPWGSFSGSLFMNAPAFEKEYSLYYVHEDGSETFLQKGTFAKMGAWYYRVNPHPSIIVVPTVIAVPKPAPKPRQEPPDLPY